MKNYETSKTVTQKVIQTQAKNEIVPEIVEMLRQMYGAENVAIGRTGDGKSKVNEIVVRFGTVDGESDICFTINPVVKGWTERKTKTATYKPFDFDEAVANYDKWAEEKEEKARKKKEEKAKTEEN